MPAKVKPAHHRGTHQVRARRIVDAANANPDTRCWRCGRTLDQVRAVKPRARWTAGHLHDGEVDGALLAECSPCNYGSGAALGNKRRGARRATTRPPRPPQPLPTRNWLA